MARMGHRTGVHSKGFRERPDGKTPVARASRRWENNIIMAIQDVI